MNFPGAPSVNFHPLGTGEGAHKGHHYQEFFAHLHKIWESRS